MSVDSVSQDYEAFIAKKRISHIPTGFDPPDKLLNPHLKPWQADICRWDIRKGRACNWLDTGLGKTIIFLSYADAVVRHTNCKALVVSPLAVSHQTKREADKFGINDVKVCRENSEVSPSAGITITNYERLHKFDLSQFDVVIPDESGCMRDFNSKTTAGMIDDFRNTRYKLPSTATPAPNDQMELGTHSEFIGSMTRNEMLSMFFVHDGGETSKWRLRGHAIKKFYQYLATFAVAIRKPSDIGYSNEGYDLPPLNFHEHCVPSPVLKGRLFAIEAKTLGDQRKVRKETVESRVEMLRGLVTKGEHQVSSTNPWVVWCNLNYESVYATKELRSHGAVEVTGSEDPDAKEEKLIAFSNGQIPILVTKGAIAGRGLNWQHCHNMARLGIGNSFEEEYQIIRRCYRFLQEKPVNVHSIISESDAGIVKNLKRKQAESDSMNAGMVLEMGDITKCELRKIQRLDRSYNADKAMRLQPWLRSGW